MKQDNVDVIEINFKEIFYLIIHRLWIILLSGFIGAAGAGACSSFLMEPVYTSTTMVYVISRQDGEKTTYSDLQMGAQLTKDYSILVKSRPVTEHVIEKFDLPITHEELADMISVENPEGTRILEIAVEYSDPKMAKQLADAIAKEASGRMVSIMEMEKVNVLEPGNLPIHPTSPKVPRNILLGGVIGVIVSAFVIIVLHLINDTIRTSEDVERYLDMTTLGTIPKIENKMGKKKNKELIENKIVLESYGRIG
ncbi:MAG: polysaccharide export protein [Lachnospiraceae bacterium]|jgi:capsular polysaccharide biosynthesis protein|nr:polysaccharide export protein [Lachnospiraceae bacterium]